MYTSGVLINVNASEKYREKFGSLTSTGEGPIPYRPQSMTVSATRYMRWVHRVLSSVSQLFWGLVVPHVYVMLCGCHGCGRYGLWPMWFVANMVVVDMVMLCGRYVLWPIWSDSWSGQWPP